jgi:hypothetical protein
MEDAARRTGRPGRWILLGCAGLGGVVLLGFAGCAGIFYLIIRLSAEEAAVGAEALRTNSEVRARFGEDVTVERTWWRSESSTKADGGGYAHFSYSATGGKGGGSAEVWLTRTLGRWSVLRMKIRPSNAEPFEIDPRVR